MSNADDPRAAYVAICAQRFAQDGYHGASLSALARDAGVTKQALLHFFGTKERLYAAVLQDLAARLCAKIDATAQADAGAHLLVYFQSFHAEAAQAPADIKLVVRALLDSDPDARIWPLKPYLDRLIALARQTPGGRAQTDSAILAWMSHVIGLVEYQTIAKPAMTGMYGAATSDAMRDHLAARLTEIVEGFTNAR